MHELEDAGCTIVASHVHESAQPLQALASSLTAGAGPVTASEAASEASSDVEADATGAGVVPPAPVAIVFGNEVSAGAVYVVARQP